MDVLLDISAQEGTFVPLVKVSLLKGRSVEERDAIATTIQRALVSAFGVPFSR